MISHQLYSFLGISIPGYVLVIGSILIPNLLENNYKVIGLSAENLKENLLCDYDFDDDRFNYGINNIEIHLSKNIDAIFCITSISYEPLGELSQNIRHEINYRATINLATITRNYCVKIFIYPSFQNIFGISNLSVEFEEYDI